MSAILNDRDKALQASIFRSKATSVTITASAATFKTAKNGGITTPSNIVLTAVPNSVFTSAVVYTWYYALSTSPTVFVSLGTGTTKTITNTDILSIIGEATQIQYKCIATENLQDTAYGFFTVIYTKELSEPILVSLSRSNAILTLDLLATVKSYDNTNTSISVTRGSTVLSYSATAQPNSFSVAIDATQAAGRTAGSITNTATSWDMGNLTSIDTDGAKVVFIVTVYDASGVLVSPTIGKEIVYSLVSEGPIGATIYPNRTFDFAGSVLPTGTVFAGTVTSSDVSTTTTLTNSAIDQGLYINSLDLVPANNYTITMRIKLLSGPWEGVVYYTNSAHGANGSYYKVIPKPIVGAWATINLDMRTLDVGGTEYLTGGNITSLRFDFVNVSGGSVVVDYINIGKFGVAEATKTTTVSAYAWSITGQPTASQAFTYTWSNGAVSAYPSGWTSYATAAPGSGYTLYQLNLVISDVSTKLTTLANWSGATANSIGYRLDGTIGVQGTSSRTAYIVTTSGTPPGVPTAATGDNAPSGWSFTATSVLTVGQYMYQADGILPSATGIIYFTGSITGGNTLTITTGTVPSIGMTIEGPGITNGTVISSGTGPFILSKVATNTNSVSMTGSTVNNIVWGNPYLSNLKVGSLSAISANLGSITSGSININNKFIIDPDGATTIQNASTGARLLITNKAIKVYDSLGTLRVQIGDLSA